VVEDARLQCTGDVEISGGYFCRQNIEKIVSVSFLSTKKCHFWPIRERCIGCRQKMAKMIVFVDKMAVFGLFVDKIRGLIFIVTAPLFLSVSSLSLI